MDWITDRVAVGNYLEAQDADLLRKESIASVLCLDRTRPRSPAASKSSWPATSKQPAARNVSRRRRDMTTSISGTASSQHTRSPC
jgi:hypothetical protein